MWFYLLKVEKMQKEKTLWQKILYGMLRMLLVCFICNFLYKLIMIFWLSFENYHTIWQVVILLLSTALTGAYGFSFYKTVLQHLIPFTKENRKIIKKWTRKEKIPAILWTLFSRWFTIWYTVYGIYYLVVAIAVVTRLN